jgi:short subunit dehydrogenase-like uncharacterized protein
MAAAKTFDVVLWGATGFTGQMCTAYLAQNPVVLASVFTSTTAGEVPGTLRYALAGRNRAKLEQVKEAMGCAADVPIFVADADDPAAVDAVVAQAKVVIALAGPFLLYGSNVVSACARFGTHYVDITGETHWVAKMIEDHEAQAVASGAAIVPLCGFDSIPSDIGCLAAIEELRRAEPGVAIRRVSCVQHFPSAGASGGSMANGPALAAHGPLVLKSGRDLDDVFLLGGEPAAGAREEDAFPTGAVEVTPGVWGSPFMMGSINIRTVRRSHALLGYGEDFCYQEYNTASGEAHAQKQAAASQKPPPPPWKIQEMIDAGRLPKPGEGPGPEARAVSTFATTHYAESATGARAVARVSGGEAGYEETAKMVCEAGLALALEFTACPASAGGGFLTPASAMGAVLARRLNAAGIAVEVLEPSRGGAKL